MSAGHSPYPWRLGAIADARGREYGLELGIYDVHSSKIAVLEQWTGAAQAEAEANHRLMVAAPELLAALRDLCSHYPVPVEAGTGLAESVNRARAAIAKAQGGAA